MSEEEERHTTILGIRIPELTLERKIRLIIITIGLIGLIVNTTTGFSLPVYDVECVEDLTFNATSKINNFLRTHSKFSIFIKSFFSVLFDSFLIYTFIYWSLYSKNFRFLITILSNIIVYQILKQFWEIKLPDEYFWSEKHLFSIFINYNQTNKTFYACELALIIVAALELKRLGNNVFFWIGFSLYMIESFLMICFRGHFFLDVFTPGFLGHYLFIIVEYFVQKFLGNENIDINHIKISSSQK